MARRRKITGAPLLLASAGMALAVGCSGNGRGGPVVTGNLMPPPKVQGTVCVDATPDTATIQVQGKIVTERCTSVETWGQAEVEVSAPGHLPDKRLVDLIEGQQVEVSITLTAEPARPPDPPRGNLMPPPEIREKPPAEK